MLSFKELSEKKTKVTLNPKLKDVMEKQECNHTKKGMKCPMHGMKPCPDTEMSEGKKTGSCGKPAAECMCDKKEKTPAQRSIETKTNSMEEQAYVSQEEVSEESTEEVAQTETSLLTFKQFNEDRAADAQKSLDKVKKRQKVLDKYEKDTGRKADIKKTPEYKQHKMRFPGAKRTGKKVPGAKETELQQHNRRVSKHNERLIKHGPTKKEAERQKGYDAYEKKHKRGNRSVWD